MPKLLASQSLSQSQLTYVTDPVTTKQGLRTPDEAFFHGTFGLGQTNWADKFWGIWRIFGQFISTHFGTVSKGHVFH